MDNISGENVQEWERNGHACQTWFLDAVHMAEADLLQGDMNEDGKLNAIDLTLLKREAWLEQHMHSACRHADLNGDTKINSEDVKLLADYLVCRGALSDISQISYAIDQNYSRG